MEREQTDERRQGSIPLDAAPAIARLTAGAWLRGAAWGASTALRTTRRLADAARSGDSAAELIDDARTEIRRLLGVGADAPPTGYAPDPGSGADSAGGLGEAGADPQRLRRLRERGAALLERASEVEGAHDPVHPGFERIIDQLAPDEARILKLMATEGPQAIVYVHRAAPFGIGARQVARRLSLIGREAGCLHPKLVPAYIDNLVRLGLVAIRRDPVPDESPYQVLEAQPEVAAALQEATGGLFRGRTSRRSVQLSDFGASFCEVCFPAGPRSGAPGPGGEAGEASAGSDDSRQRRAAPEETAPTERAAPEEATADDARAPR